MEARVRQGGRPVKEKPLTIKAKRSNAENRLQYLLVPYAELSDNERNKDRDSVLNYVTIIDQADYRIEISSQAE